MVFLGLLLLVCGVDREKGGKGVWCSNFIIVVLLEYRGSNVEEVIPYEL